METLLFAWKSWIQELFFVPSYIQDRRIYNARQCQQLEYMLLLFHDNSWGLCLLRPWKLLTTKRGSCDVIWSMGCVEGWRKAHQIWTGLVQCKSTSLMLTGMAHVDCMLFFWFSLPKRCFPSPSFLNSINCSRFLCPSGPVKDSYTNIKHQYSHSAQGTLLLKQLLPWWLLGKIFGKSLQSFWDSRIATIGKLGYLGICQDPYDMGGDVKDWLFCY